MSHLLSKSRLQRYAALLLPLVAALTGGTGALKATNLLTATPTTINLTCNTTTGPGAAAAITVKSATPLTNTTIAVTLGSLTGGVVVSPSASQTLNATNSGASGSGIVYTVGLAAGCVGVTTAAPTFHFNAGGVSDVSITVNTTLTAATSGLSVAPASVTVTCTLSSGTYTAGPAQTVSVTSAAAGGTPFTVDTSSASAVPAWLSVTPPSGGTAGSTAVPLSVVAASGCGTFASGSSHTWTVHLLNAPGPDKTIAVTLNIVLPTALTATPSPASMSYIKTSGNPGSVAVAITTAVTPAPFFSIDTTSLPVWLTVDSFTGTTPKTLHFSSTSVCDTLAPGTYSATVRLNVSGYAPLQVPVSLLVTNAAPRLAIVEGTSRPLTWTIGQPLPTAVITALSTDSPIPYTITTGGALAPIVPSSQLNGLAYSFGTPISVSFTQSVFSAAQPGNILTGTVTLGWGNPATTTVVTFNITVLSPGATITTLSPAALPTASAGTVFTVSLSGSGFVISPDPTQRTRVGVVVSGAVVLDTFIAANIINPSNMILTITVPSAADPNLPFAPTGTGGNVVIGVCNPVGGACTIPTGQATLSIGSNPIIQAVTSSSSLIQVAAPAVPSIAPFDMISIFGANFCASGATGCTSTQVLAGTPDPVTFSYPKWLSPDATGATQRQLSVTFQTLASPPVVLGTAPLLFATNSQINLLVPAGVAAQFGNQVSIVVNFGYGTGATMKSSAPYTVNIVHTDPGIFTIGADGQGNGAALDTAYSLITSANPAGMRSTATDSDTIQIFMTGLGVPDSTSNDANAGGSYSWPADCASPASFLTQFNTLTGNSLTSLDGTLLLTSVLSANTLAPCILQTVSGSADPDLPSVKIGGVDGTVTYAGWVPSTVAGLYQVNVSLPGSGAGPFTNSAGQAVSSLTAPVQLPVIVIANSQSSQTGVTIWVAPKLKVTAPTAVAGTVGVAWSNTNNSAAATEGSSPYRYAVTSGLLPAGLSLNTSTGAITGTPAANTAGSYKLTVTATDSANVPVSGTASFTLTVAGGLFVTSTGTAPYNATYGASANLTTVSATSGTYPYTYAITAPATVPAGLAVSTGGILSTSAVTPAGTYSITVTATDSTTGTPLTGGITFGVVEALHVTNTAPTSQTALAGGAITTLTTTGNTGTVSYTLGAGAPACLSVDSSGNVTAGTTCSANSYTVTVTATDGTAPSNATAAGTGAVTFTVQLT